MPPVEVVRTFLELRSPEQLVRSGSPPPGVVLRELRPCPVDVSRRLYREVGERFHWQDRLAVPDDELAEYLGRDTVRVFVARSGLQDDGFFELVRHDDGSVEIAMFGLLAHAHGRGIGKWLLIRAAETAFEWGATRVWLHTCTLDSPAAMPNYRGRGFTPYATDRYTTTVPAAGGGA